MRSLLARLALLLAIAWGIQVVLVSAGMDRYRELERFSAALRSGADVVYFGDSVLYTCDDTDRDRRSIPDLLHEQLGAARLAVVQHGSYTAADFRGFCRAVARSRTRPSVGIVPVNLRCFSPEMDMRPSYQRAREKYLLRWCGNLPVSALYRPLAVLNAFKPVSESQFRGTLVYDGRQVVGTVSDFLDTQQGDPQTIAARGMVFHYMGALRSDHRKLKALRDTCGALEAAGVQPLVYVTPIDCDTGVKLVGPRFRRQVRENVRTVRAALPTQKVIWLDLSETLPPAAFSWRTVPNEHLKEQGRRYVAARLAAVLRRWRAENPGRVPAPRGGGEPPSPLRDGGEP